LKANFDSQSGLGHSAVVTSANVHDKLPDLLHGNERRVYGDSAYASQHELIASKAPLAKDFTNDRVRNNRGEVDQVKQAKNRNKSRIRRAPALGGVSELTLSPKRLLPNG
jgi:IS5 family transposase